MKLHIKTGDITFQGGKINGVETTLEFAGIEEYKEYLACQKETMEDLKKFLKVDIPEIIQGIGEAVETVIEGSEEAEPVDILERIQNAFAEAGLKEIKPVQAGGISIKESAETTIPKGFKVAEQGEDAEIPGITETLKFTDFYKGK